MLPPPPEYTNMPMKQSIESNFNILRHPANLRLSLHSQNQQMQIETLSNQIQVLERQHLVEKTKRIELQNELAKLDEIYGRKIAEFEGMEKLQKGLEEHNRRLTEDGQSALEKFESAQKTIKTLMLELQAEKNRNLSLTDNLRRRELELDEQRKLITQLEEEAAKERDTAKQLKEQSKEQSSRIAKLNQQNFLNIDSSQKKYDDLQNQHYKVQRALQEKTDQIYVFTGQIADLNKQLTA